MSLIVEWQGRQYDIDIFEWTQRELDLVEQKAGLDWMELATGGRDCVPTAIRALFWLIDQRDDDKLAFGTYDGPPMRLWLEHLAEWKALYDSVGKQWRAALGIVGSGASPSTVDTAPPPTTP